MQKRRLPATSSPFLPAREKTIPEKMRKKVLREAYKKMEQLRAENPGFVPTKEKLAAAEKEFWATLTSGEQTAFLRRTKQAMLTSSPEQFASMIFSQLGREKRTIPGMPKNYSEIDLLRKGHANRGQKTNLTAFKEKAYGEIERIGTAKGWARSRIKALHTAVKTLQRTGGYGYTFRKGIRYYEVRMKFTKPAQIDEVLSFSSLDPRARKWIKDPFYHPNIRRGEEQITVVDVFMRRLITRINVALHQK